MTRAHAHLVLEGVIWIGYENGDEALAFTFPGEAYDFTIIQYFKIQ
jgi:hypothetical protein